MDTKELSNELREWVILGEEGVNLEYKSFSPWSDRIHQLKVAKAMMGMSNIRGGGVIVIGVNEDGVPAGVPSSHLNTYTHDNIAKYLKSRTSPPINFHINRGKTNVKIGNAVCEKNFIVIQVSPANTLPLICTKPAKLNEHDKKDYLRENALYIRSKSPIETREIGSYHEWQDFIDFLLEKNQKSLIDKLPAALFRPVTPAIKKSDSEKFKEQRG